VAARLAEETEREVETALQDATRLLKEARWADAQTAVARAQGRLGDGGSADSADLRRRVRQARADLDMVRRLEEIRLEQGQVRDGKYDYRAVDPAYALAFQKYGLDVRTLEPKEAAARIVGSAIREQLIAALDNWMDALSRSDREKSQRLLAVVRLADEDDVRRQIRDFVEGRDGPALEKLATRRETLAQPPVTLVLLSRKLVKPKSLELAVDLLRRAQQQHPGDFWLNFELALSLVRMKPARTDEAIGYWRGALAVNSSSHVVYLNLGGALASQGKHAEAEAAHRKAIALQPDYAKAHYSLGNALWSQGKYAEAEAAFRKAIALKPDYPEAHAGLGLALREQKKLGEAVAAFRKADQLRTGPPLFRNDLRLTERWLELDKRFPAILAGTEELPGARDQIAFAQFCAAYKRHYPAAVRFYAEAFATDPNLADDLRLPHRYTAARYAVLAAAGKGEDAGKLEDRERAGLRRQALDWLRSDLAALSKLVANSPAQARAFAEKKLQHRRVDPDLETVRDAEALARLPEAERRAWQQLWADVDALLQRLRKAKDP
jgi:tetratricopeptide (TPR) repeat protein